MGTTKGAPVGYRQVTIQTRSPTLAGQELHEFTSPFDQPDLPSSFIYAGPSSQDFQRGLLTHQAWYAWQSTGLVPVQEKRWTYVFARPSVPGVATQADGWKVGYRLLNQGYLINPLLDVFTGDIIPHRTHTVRLVSESARTYGPDGAYSEQLTRYGYDAPLATHPVTRKTLVRADQWRTTKTRFSTAYDTTAFLAGMRLAPGTDAYSLRQLQRRHVLVPLEEQVWTTQPGDSALVGVGVRRYNAQAQLRATYQLAVPAPLPQGAGYVSPSLTATGNLLLDTRLQQREAYERYSPWGNLVQYRRPAARATSQAWDETLGQLTAECQGAALGQWAATSFEANGAGYWLYDVTHQVPGGQTGRSAYLLDGQASVWSAPLPAGDYELTYWAQGPTPVRLWLGDSPASLGAQVVRGGAGSGQQYRTRLHLTGPASVRLDTPAGSSALLLDELRLCPVGTQLTSYTYDPLVGMTSQTDPTGRTVTYEYDGLGRLVRTRDEQGRILSQQQYHYVSGK